MTTSAQLSASLAGRYEIGRELGQGGMATVYAARDVRHDRDVAIKVLHPDLGAALGGERFLSEIKTTAKLQHPHILPLLDSGDADGLLYYVMPVATGETLRDRLTRERQLPIDDALRIAREVADALGYAHAAGIIHRDIKPENILLQGGHALVADFGIALAVQTAAGSRMTQTGLSLGTPQYMSPEQAMGERVIDARSDIYALGAVTYEMLTGDPPFTGSSVQAIVAKVLTEKPTRPSTVRDTCPPAVEGAVLTALAKLPADRFATAADFSAALIDRTNSGTQNAAAARAAARRRSQDPLVLGLGALSIALAVSVGALARRAMSAEDPFPARFELASEDAKSAGAALSPDGHSVAFVGSSKSERKLFLRRLDQLTSRELAGSGGPSGYPTFSPDGKAVAYIAGRRKLMKVPLDGGAPVALADVADYGGVAWSPTGDIVIGQGVLEGHTGLLRVPAAGGKPVQFTHVDTAAKELSHQWPVMSSDGKTVLFTIWLGTPERAEVAAASLDEGKVVRVGITGGKVLGVLEGYVVYVNADGTIMAAPYDERRFHVSGAAIPIESGIRLASNGGFQAEASLTRAGGLAFLQGDAKRRLVWVDRAGVARPAVEGAAREFIFLRLSPDGKKVAATISTGVKQDLWTLDLAAGTLTPVTTTGSTRNPSWSSDSRRVLYTSTHGGKSSLWWQAADGSGTATLAAEAPHNPWWVDLSPDGRSVAYNAVYDGSFNVQLLSLDSSHAARDLAASPIATEARARFSPDGKWIAYNSDESGKVEVYVRPVAESGGRVLISSGGGVRPVWSPDGTRIYYRSDSTMISATLSRDPALHVVSREKLFSGRYEDDFDISKDGTRFLMIESETSGPTLVVVPNWRTELRRRTAKGGL
jgi:serine/threonine-protein kinase